MADNFASMQQLLTSYGLQSLVPRAREWFQKGLSDDELILALESEQAYQTRFSAVFERRKRGLPPISASDVLTYERAARAREQQYGLPAGFLDANRMLTEDVSIDEANQRLAMTSDYVRSRADVQEQFRQLYGGGELDNGTMMALFVDTERALPLLTEQWSGARISADAARSGFGSLSALQAKFLTDEGLNADGAKEAFDQLMDSQQLFKPLTDQTGRTYSPEEQLSLLVGSSRDLTREIERRARSRVGAFEGGGGTAFSQSGYAGAGGAS